MSIDPEQIAGYDRAWRELSEGVVNRKHGFHTFTLATVDKRGDPQARTLVLREADAARRILRFNCDARSPKFAELAASPRVCAVFYGEAEKFQVRVWGTMHLHVSDAEARAVWDAMQPISRDCYRLPFAPSDTRAAPGDAVAEPASLAEALQNFAVCRLHVQSLEWLALHRAGHTRARHDFDADGTMTARWLNP